MTSTVTMTLTTKVATMPRKDKHDESDRDDHDGGGSAVLDDDGDDDVGDAT